MKADKKRELPRDDLSKRLQESLRKRRPRTFPVLITAVVLTAALLGFMIWWLYPRPAPPRMMAFAFDQTGLAGKDVVLHGMLQPMPGENRTVRLKDLEVIFEDGGFRKQGERPTQITVKTTPSGAASCPWSFPDGFTQGEFIVRSIGTREAPGTNDRGRVVLWPQNSRLALVQIENTLTLAREETWIKENTLDIPPMKGAADALRRLEAGGFHIVYLALAAEEPFLYQKMRGWVRVQSGDPSPFPVGPVLSKLTMVRDANKPWQIVGAELQEKFAGPHVAVVSAIDAAQQLHAAGLDVYFLGKSDDLPAGVRRVESWAELRGLVGK
ncbi:MAG: hypothetical protein HY040_26475 [Planctomycetes bacterium]|nr:hypothetical protein [Planctomycetota bacterium]